MKVRCGGEVILVDIGECNWDSLDEKWATYDDGQSDEGTTENSEEYDAIQVRCPPLHNGPEELLRRLSHARMTICLA